MRITILTILIACRIANHEALAAQRDCPDPEKPAQLQEWRDRWLTQMPILWRNADQGKERDLNKLQAHFDTIGRCFRGDAPECMDRLRVAFDDAVQSGDRTLRVTLRRSMVDDTAANEFAFAQGRLKPSDLPAEFRIPAEGEDPERFRIPANIEGLAKSKGWKALRFKTRRGGGFSSTGTMLFVLIPGERRDVFLQIDLRKDETHPANDPRFGSPESQFTELAKSVAVGWVDKKAIPPVGWIANVITSSDTFPVPGSYGTNQASCMQCHIQPLRVISPVGFGRVHGTERRMDANQEGTVNAINDVIRGYGSMRWGAGAMTQSAFLATFASAPPVGWLPRGNADRANEYLRKCIAKSEMEPVELIGFGGYSATFPVAKGTVTADRIRQAMNCTQCHRAKGLANPFSGDYRSRELMSRILLDHSMPPGRDDLTADERAALASCVSQLRKDPDYLADWFGEQSCVPPAQPSAPVTSSGSQSSPSAGASEAGR